MSFSLILSRFSAHLTILFASYSSSTNYIIYRGGGRKRKKDVPLCKVLEDAKELLASYLSGEGSTASSSRVAARKPRAPATYYYSKVSLTVKRKTNCKYRPRGPKAAGRTFQDDLSSNISGDHLPC